NLPIFKRLGVLEQVDAIGIKKPGADFNSNLDVSGHHQFHFSFALDKNHPYAYEVRRSEFDNLLLRNSAAKGTQVLEGMQASAVPPISSAARRVRRNSSCKPSRSDIPRCGIGCGTPR